VVCVRRRSGDNSTRPVLCEYHCKQECNEWCYKQKHVACTAHCFVCFVCYISHFTFSVKKSSVTSAMSIELLPSVGSNWISKTDGHVIRVINADLLSFNDEQMCAVAFCVTAYPTQPIFSLFTEDDDHFRREYELVNRDFIDQSLTRQRLCAG